MAKWTARRTDHGERGFTLLEIMLVVVLIGITVTFVNLNLSPDPATIAWREGERVAALLRQLRDESILRGRPMSLEFDEASQQYAFGVLESGEWKQVEGDELFRPRGFQRPVRASMSIRPGAGEDEDERSDANEDEGRHDGRFRVVVDPIGEITPFVMTLRAEGNEVIVGLDAYAEVVVAKPGDDA